MAELGVVAEGDHHSESVPTVFQMHGLTIQVLNAMHPLWKQKSELAQFLENQRYLGCTNSPVMSGHRFQEKDLTRLDHTIMALRDVQKQVAHSQEYYCRIGELLEFLRHFRKDLPSQTPQQAFERVQLVRRWLFWLPPAMLRGGETDISTLAILAQFFAVGVVLDGIFPDLGGAYLGPLSIGPIEDIYRIIAARNTTDPFNPDLQLAITLMDLPQQTVAQYKNRLYLSPRPSIDYAPPTPASPYPQPPVHDSRLASSPSTTSSYTPYTPPLQSPPEVGVPNSPFDLVDYITSPATQGFYPPSPGLLSEHRNSLPTTYPDIVCGEVPRPGEGLGLMMGYYDPPSDLVAPEGWT